MVRNLSNNPPKVYYSQSFNVSWLRLSSFTGKLTLSMMVWFRNHQIKAVISCSTHKINQQETDRKNQNTAIQILGESSTNPSCLQKYFAS